MLGQGSRDGLDDQVIEQIAARVAEVLQAKLETIAAALSPLPTPTEQLTVGQVAQRLGVTRSTVYVHWREWGGYKLGRSSKAPIRFDSSALPIERRSAPADKTPELASAAMAGGRGRRRPPRALLQDAPRLAAPFNRQP